MHGDREKLEAELHSTKRLIEEMTQRRNSSPEGSQEIGRSHFAILSLLQTKYNLQEKLDALSHTWILTLWADKAEQFFAEQNLKWIFVSLEEPFNNARGDGGERYGDNCFYVMLPDSNVTTYLGDFNESNSDMIVYNANTPPQLIPMQKTYELV